MAAKRGKTNTVKAPGVTRNRYISVRVSQAEYAAIAAQADGRSTMSALVRARAFGRSSRDDTTLRHISALVRAGHGLHELARAEYIPKPELQELLLTIRSEIERLARHVP